MGLDLGGVRSTRLAVAAVVAAVTLLAPAGAIGPLLYPSPRCSRLSTEMELRFWAPFVAPFLGAGLARVGLPSARVISASRIGAMGLVGLMIGLMTRPWPLWAGTRTMALHNTAWVGGVVFVSAWLGTLLGRRKPRAKAQPISLRS